MRKLTIAFALIPILSGPAAQSRRRDRDNGGLDTRGPRDCLDVSVAGHRHDLSAFRPVVLQYGQCLGGALGHRRGPHIVPGHRRNGPRLGYRRRAAVNPRSHLPADRRHRRHPRRRLRQIDASLSKSIANIRSTARPLRERAQYASSYSAKSRSHSSSTPTSTTPSSRSMQFPSRPHFCSFAAAGWLC